MRADYDDPQVAHAVAKGLLGVKCSYQAYSMLAAPNEFLCQELERTDLRSQDLENIVSRELSEPAKDAFLNRKKQLVQPVLLFLRYNRLSSTQVQPLLKYTHKQILRQVLEFQCHALSYEEFKTLYCKVGDSLDLLAGFLNYEKEFEVQDLMDLLHRKPFDLASMSPLKELVVLYPQILDKFRELTFLEPSQTGFDAHTIWQFTRVYIELFAYTSFRSSQHFEKHLETVLHVQSNMSEVHRQDAWRSIQHAALNPRVSTAQASDLLEKARQNVKADTLRLETWKEMQTLRSEAFEHGFDVFYGSYQDVTSNMLEGLTFLFSFRRTYFNPLVPHAFTLEALGASLLRKESRVTLLRELKFESKVVSPWVESLLWQDDKVSNERAMFFIWRTNKSAYWASRLEPLEKHPWLQFACQKLGSDPVSWQTFFLLAKQQLQDANIEGVMRMVENTYKVSCK